MNADAQNNFIHIFGLHNSGYLEDNPSPPQKKKYILIIYKGVYITYITYIYYIYYIYVIILKSIAIKCDAGVRNQQIGIHVQYYFQGLTVIIH